MIELEDRLRATLTELAESVPVSQHPRADLERRLAQRTPARGRRPLLVAAAAAAVLVAGVAVPVALDGDPRVGRQPTAAPDTTAGHHVLGTFTENATTYDAIAWLRGDELCVGRTGQVDSGGCEPVPSWPTRQANALVVSRTVLGGATLDSGPVPHLMLFLTAPQVEVLDVRAGDGSPVNVRVLEWTDRFNLFLADFDGSAQGYGYTAKDSAGTVLEEAIT